MGLMDKLKSQAGQVATKAQQGMQQGMQQGQAKYSSVQAKRQNDSLLRDLGAAYYAEQRQGGSHAAVDAALDRLDAQAADPASAEGETDATAGTDTTDTTAATGTTATTGTAATSETPTAAAPPDPSTD
ncbi:MAG: hypothetical protein ACRDYY_07320 [Acidimicrobiales bacterium]